MTNSVFVPPIKCQGIKTKLVPFIVSSITWDRQGYWIEPFLGFGVVLFNIQPKRALVGDINPHIINFYQLLYQRKLRADEVEKYLVCEGQKLLLRGEEHYYSLREYFNKTSDPLAFIFLNRACFNGVMRFNRRGDFNVPFCRKRNRFQRAYITKIVNQIARLQEIMLDKDWEFYSTDWYNLVQQGRESDFIYLDPPYIARHTDYYQKWSEADFKKLLETVEDTSCGFALSMWKQNCYRENSYIKNLNHLKQKSFSHFYHVGSRREFRNHMEEVLLIKPGYENLPSG